MSKEALVFEDIELEEQEVVIGKNRVRYILTEAGGQAWLDYQSDQAESIVFEDGQAAGLENVSQADINLLSKCLFRVKVEEGKPDKLVPVVIRDFLNTVKKGSVINQLCEKCKEMSGIIADKDTVEEIEKQMKKLEKKLEKAKKKEDKEKK